MAELRPVTSRAALRQAARLEPGSRGVLRCAECASARTAQPVDWWLTGERERWPSRGVPVEPGGLDLVCDAQGASVSLVNLFCDTLIRAGRSRR